MAPPTLGETTFFHPTILQQMHFSQRRMSFKVGTFKRSCTLSIPRETCYLLRLVSFHSIVGSIPAPGINYHSCGIFFPCIFRALEPKAFSAGKNSKNDRKLLTKLSGTLAANNEKINDRPAFSA